MEDKMAEAVKVSKDIPDTRHGLTRGYGGPMRYVQGPGVLGDIGDYASGLARSALVVMDSFVEQGFGPQVTAALSSAGIAVALHRFGGENTDTEVARCAATARDEKTGLIIGIGGGKAIDTAKLAARDVGTCVMTVPTIASTDGPTSAISVMYTADGIYDRVERCPRHPDVVLVDSDIIAKAPVRFFSAGMGDALTTWYEARSSYDSQSKNYINEGCAPPIAGAAIARACHETLMRDGIAAFEAVQSGCLTQAVENIIEANTLLSGLGFENCGVSAAHGVHDALTVLEPTHRFLHGEKVAFGIVCLLVLENRPMEEITEAVRFCAAIGLPVTLGDLELGDVTDDDLMRVGNEAMNPASVIHSVPLPLTARRVAHAIRAADAIAARVTHQ